MKVYFALCALFVLIAAAFAAPAPQQEVSIVNYVNENDGTGNYHFAYELSDGQSRDETGSLKTVPGAEEPVVVMQGTYTFTDDQGKTHKVTYTADETGFHPVVES